MRGGGGFFLPLTSKMLVNHWPRIAVWVHTEYLACDNFVLKGGEGTDPMSLTSCVWNSVWLLFIRSFSCNKHLILNAERLTIAFKSFRQTGSIWRSLSSWPRLNTAWSLSSDTLLTLGCAWTCGVGSGAFGVGSVSTASVAGGVGGGAGSLGHTGTQGQRRQGCRHTLVVIHPGNTKVLCCSVLTQSNNNILRQLK